VRVRVRVALEAFFAQEIHPLCLGVTQLYNLVSMASLSFLSLANKVNPIS
jgi:hypothetical protein